MRPDVQAHEPLLNREAVTDHRLTPLKKSRAIGNVSETYLAEQSHLSISKLHSAAVWNLDIFIFLIIDSKFIIPTVFGEYARSDSSFPQKSKSQPPTPTVRSHKPDCRSLISPPAINFDETARREPGRKPLMRAAYNRLARACIGKFRGGAAKPVLRIRPPSNDYKPSTPPR